MIHLPRRTGEVVVPLAVTLRTLACVMKPPRGLSGGSLHATHGDRPSRRGCRSGSPAAR